MKTRNKIIALSLAFITVFSLFSTLNPIVVNALSEIEKQKALEKSLEESQKCADFIEQNFWQVVYEYNCANAEKTGLCLATYIEGRSTVIVTDTNKYGIYLDFDGNNGYLLVTENYMLLEFSPEGDLDYLKNVPLAYYNSFDKFMYIKPETGLFERYDYEDNSSDFSGDSALFNSENNNLPAPAAGQYLGGDGYIYNIDAYVSAVYPEYDYDSRYIMSGYEWIYQYDTSVYYYQPEDASENNCVINATYSMMNDWYNRGRFQWLPSGTFDFSGYLESDPLYTDFGNNITTGWRRRPRTDLTSMPYLYMELRNYAIEYGYRPDTGMQFSRIVDMVGRVASSRGYTLTMSSTSTFTYVKYLIDTNQACVIGTSGSSSYENHAMALYGYVKYTYTDGWWVFETTEDKYFYVVDDGHDVKLERPDLFQYNFMGVNCPVSYFDPNAANPAITFYYLNG